MVGAFLTICSPKLKSKSIQYLRASLVCVLMLWPQERHPCSPFLFPPSFFALELACFKLNFPLYPLAADSFPRCGCEWVDSHQSSNLFVTIWSNPSRVRARVRAKIILFEYSSTPLDIWIQVITFKLPFFFALELWRCDRTLEECEFESQ